MSTLTSLLPDRAAERPDATAIVDVSRTWTWAEAAHRSATIARALLDAGVERGDRVGVSLRKCAEGVCAMHAVVSLGAIAVPIDPASPAERVERIRRAMSIRVVVAHGPTFANVEDAGFESVISADNALLDGLDPAIPVVVDPTDHAYIITSSGSTGEPKGIVHSHETALGYVHKSLELFPMTVDDRVADIAPHHFDISTHSLWSVPSIGATLVVFSEPYQQFPASHTQRLQDEAVTHWYAVPFLIQQMVLRGDLENRDLSALEWVQFGGEVIPSAMVAAFMSHAPNATLANVFGPAETNMCTFHVLETPPSADTVIPIGRVTPRTRLRIIRPNAPTPELVHESAVGDAGVGWVAGDGVMVEYFEDDARNAAVFAEVDGDRWYRTGDLVSTDPATGLLHFHGREDMQIKVRGHRVEVEGIEVELESIDGVDGVVVGVLRRAGGEDELVAGVVTPPADFDPAAFLSIARERLPSWSAPAQVVILAHKKFTGSGKLARRALRDEAVQLAQDAEATTVEATR